MPSPRVQSGELGSNSRFEPVPHDYPAILDLDISCSKDTGFCKKIAFSVSAPSSACVYVRILVQKKGRSIRYFVRSDQTLNMPETEGGLPEGAWDLKCVSLGSWPNGVLCCWQGKIVKKTKIETSAGLAVIGENNGDWTITPPEVEDEEPGPDYAGVDGTYHFFLQCVDEGGNVSEEWSYIADIKW